MSSQHLTESHSRKRSFLFRLKTAAFSLRRSVQNLFSGIRRFKQRALLTDEPAIAVSESALWNPYDNEQNHILTAGKVENLRIAVKRINGTEIPAGRTFSFWRHIGNPHFGKGYVTGREIREGCIVPTKAGGLCQLSNALYDAALEAGFTIIERHRHTQVVQGSLAERNRDATVKWKYVDLRFHSPHAFHIEAVLTDEQLIVRFKSAKRPETEDQPEFTSRTVSHLNDCVSCGNTACFNHPGTAATEKSGTTAFLLDENWPEYDNYIAAIAQPEAVFLVPVHKSRFFQTNRYSWKAAAGHRIVSANLSAFRRALAIRWANFRKANVFRASLTSDRRIALQLAKHLPVGCTHVVVSQNLLPFVWESGALGGRTFDVLMTRLPMELLHARLDLAHSRFPESPTLNDFRAPQSLIDLENAALNRARQVVTPHRGIAGIFLHKSVLPDWQLPAPGTPVKGSKVLFPASALGRKGAYEMRQLARELKIEPVIYGRSTESDRFWEGLPVSYACSFDDVGLIVYPTYVEHQPRLLLKALSHNIPVITTSAAGLPESALVKIVPVGDYEALKRTFVGLHSSLTH